MKKAVFSLALLGCVIIDEIFRLNHVASFFFKHTGETSFNIKIGHIASTKETWRKSPVGSNKQGLSIFAFFNTTLKPPIDVFMDSNNTPTKHIQHLLDYAIVGFAKCGTTSLGEWFHSHPELGGSEVENYDFQSDFRILTQALYKTIPENRSLDRPFLNGHRCPHDIQNPRALAFLAKHFPKTKLIATNNCESIFVTKEFSRLSQ